MTLRPQSVRDRQSGFTLIEVLAGLVLASLIFLGLDMTMRAVSDGVSRTRQTLGRQATLSTAIDIFGSDVARIAKLRGVGRYLFQGEGTSMVYPVEEAEGLLQRGLYLIRLSVRDAGGRTQLLRERALLRPASPLPSAEGWTDGVVLLSGNFDIGFAYRAPRAGKRDWSSSWDSSRLMPEQVSLTVTDRATGRLRVPVFVQSLFVDTEADCVAAQDVQCGFTLAAGGKP